MRIVLLALSIIGVSTLSFWAGETGRGWIAYPVGALVAVIVIATEVSATAPQTPAEDSANDRRGDER